VKILPLVVPSPAALALRRWARSEEPEQIDRIRVLEPIVGGRTVFRADDA
jgi:hypothetical protein